MTNDDDEIIHQNNGEEIHEDESIDAKAEIARLTDLLQRVQADSVNYRKRMEEERQLLREQSTRNLLLKLLPILDDFERATEHKPEYKSEHHSEHKSEHKPEYKSEQHNECKLDENIQELYNVNNKGL